MDITTPREDYSLEGGMSEYDKAIVKYHKLQTLIEITKSARPEDFEQDVSDSNRMRENLITWQLKNFYKLDNTAESLLGLGNEKVELNYTERKAIQKFLHRKIIEVCQPTVDCYRKHSMDLTPLTADENEIADLATKSQNLLIELVKVKNEKCKLLKQCTEFRVGPHHIDDVNTMSLQLQALNIKAGSLHSIINNAIYSGSPHTVKALKEVESYVDALLQEN